MTLAITVLFTVTLIAKLQKEPRFARVKTRRRKLR
jgi:hypothetical protein